MSARGIVPLLVLLVSAASCGDRKARKRAPEPPEAGVADARPVPLPSAPLEPAYVPEVAAQEAAPAKAEPAARDALPRDPALSSVVRAIQARLAERGRHPGEIDGRWGPRTANALEEYQWVHRLDRGDPPGVETLESLFGRNRARDEIQRVAGRESAGVGRSPGALAPALAAVLALAAALRLALPRPHTRTRTRMEGEPT